MSWDSTNFIKPFAIAADIALHFRVGQPFPSVRLMFEYIDGPDYGCPTAFYEVFVELAEYKDRLSSFKPTGGSAKWRDFIMTASTLRAPRFTPVYLRVVTEPISSFVLNKTESWSEI
jgi:hypothetical protein